MKLLFLADGRSPIALNWINYFIDKGDEVHLATTFPCLPNSRLASLTFIPVAFSQAKSENEIVNGERRRLDPFLGQGSAGLRTRLRQWLGPLTVPKAARSFRRIIDQIHPDLIHAMRIPFEGMVAASAVRSVAKITPYLAPPLVASVWGNDFTFHARATPLMKRYTRNSLNIANGLHTDCQRDQRLARQWGYPEGRQTLVVPGGGGVQAEVFYPLSKRSDESQVHTRVINPRGFRAYVRNDTFFRAIPLVLQSKPDVRFLCTAMAGESKAKKWLDFLDIHSAVELLPKVSRDEMAQLFRSAEVSVSPSIHDGTPNTLLEAMACGCFPIAGDIESLREWIIPGENGLLIDPNKPGELAEAILRSLSDDGLRQKAMETNQRLIAERAEYRQVMEKVETFYRIFI